MIYCTEPWAFKAFTSFKFANLVNLTNVIWMVTSPSTSSTVACSTVDYQMFFSLSIYASCSYFHFANGVNIKREFVQRKKNRKPVWIKIRNCRINKTSKRRSQRFENLFSGFVAAAAPAKPVKRSEEERKLFISTGSCSSHSLGPIYSIRHLAFTHLGLILAYISNSSRVSCVA